MESRNFTLGEVKQNVAKDSNYLSDGKMVFEFEGYPDLKLSAWSLGY